MCVTLVTVRVEGLLVSVRIHQRKDSRGDRDGGGSILYLGLREEGQCSLRYNRIGVSERNGEG